MLFLHGGGMIVGSVPIVDGPVGRYVARSGVAMLSLQYRLDSDVARRARADRERILRSL